MFHHRDNLWFGRTKHGHVRIVKLKCGPMKTMNADNERRYESDRRPFRAEDVIFDVMIVDHEWASIISTVSKGGEADGGWNAALDFHNAESHAARIAEGAAPRPEALSAPQPWDSADKQDARNKLTLIAQYMESLENFDDAVFLRRLAEQLVAPQPPRVSEEALRQLHDRLGAMIDQVGHPDYSLHELVIGLRDVRDELLRLAGKESGK